MNVGIYIGLSGREKGDGLRGWNQLPGRRGVSRHVGRAMLKGFGT